MRGIYHLRIFLRFLWWYSSGIDLSNNCVRLTFRMDIITVSVKTRCANDIIRISHISARNCHFIRQPTTLAYSQSTLGQWPLITFYTAHCKSLHAIVPGTGRELTLRVVTFTCYFRFNHFIGLFISIWHVTPSFTRYNIALWFNWYFYYYHNETIHHEKKN